MINLVDFNNCSETLRTYGGNAGQKVSMMYDDKVWLVKYPGNIKDIKDVAMSYSMSPISEYIGSHIYQMLGIPAHNTILGTLDGKIVVGCEDFCGNNNILSEFKTFKVTYRNTVDSQSNGDSTILSDVLNVITNHPILRNINSIKKRFWDMFTVDAFIGNPDRNNGNWGCIISLPNRNIVDLAPVYDNGNSLNCKWDEARMKNFLKRASKKQRIKNSSISIYRDDNMQKIYPFNYIEQTQNQDCLKSYIDIYKKLDLKSIHNVIDDIYDNKIITNIQRDFYKTVLNARYEVVMKEIYDKSEEFMLKISQEESVSPKNVSI